MIADAPRRVRQYRTKGWRMPPNTRCVTSNSPFANPFRPRVRTPGANALAVARFREWINQPEQAALLRRVRAELRGLNLACYCDPNLPCHADVLLEIANA